MATEAEHLAADVEARAVALDVARSFIVQAPAGSGKTELLIQRYLNLLTIVDEPEQVLAITFTRKAAMEMRLRVLAALRGSRDSSSASTPHERLTLDLATRVLDRDSARDWQLSRFPSRMRIETVDAFGAGIARALPISSGIGGAATTLADASMSALYRSAAAATLDWLSSDDFGAIAVSRVLEHLDNNTGQYIAHLASMLSSRDQWLAIVGSGRAGPDDGSSVRKQLEENIRRVVENHLQKVADCLPQEAHVELLSLLGYAADNLAATGAEKHPLQRFRHAAAIPGVLAEDCEGWLAIADFLLVKDGGWRKRLTRNEGFPPGEKERKNDFLQLKQKLAGVDLLRSLLQTVRSLPPPSYSDEQWSVLLALFDLLPLAVGEMKRLFGEKGVTDHAEISLAAQHALGSPDAPGDVALALDYSIRHLLVDEMQDTSIGQYNMLKTLTSGWTPGDGRTVFCVGDPMQSIYRFRDAEVGEFLLARRDGIGSLKLEPLVLRRNFRSGENLVHWVNTVFGQIMPAQDDLSTGAISYSDSVPVDAHADCGEYFVHAVLGSKPELEAQASANAIKRCLECHPEDNIAVLVRSRTQLADLLHELRLINVPYQAIEIDRLTDLPEVSDLIALTRALCDESDRLAWLALLRAPWAGLSWQDLHALVRNDSDSTIRHLLSQNSRYRQFDAATATRLDAVLDIVDKYNARHAVGSLRDRVELAWFALNGPALHTSENKIENAYRYFDVLDKIGTAGTLEDVRELESLLDVERVSTGGANNRVQIMTMHKAKGLEFDHVLLHGLGRTTRGGDNKVLSWLNVPAEQGRNEMMVSPIGPRYLLDRDPLHQFITAADQEKDRAELDRLLYVACTRARKSLHLVGHVRLSPDGTEIKKPDARTLLARIWSAVESDYNFAIERSEPQPELVVDHATANLVFPPLRRLREGWQPPGIPPLPILRHGVGQHSDDTDHQVEFYWVGSSARHAGTIVHKWLQRLSEGRIILQPGDLAGARATTERWARESGIEAGRLVEVCERVEQSLAGIINDEKGRWILFGDGHSELQITGVVNDIVESIVIDRIRIDEHGTHWIIDYKTSSHEGGDLPGFLRQESDRYRGQLEKYANLYATYARAPVKTALYFPLLQEFCEIELGR